jgi:hypothetical protein
MGLSAAKHTDMIVGMDMHLIQPPPPAPPVMVPIPVVGMILDPADYQPGACTVFVNSLPRARAGSVCLLTPPHIPIGGVFVKPPLSEAEVAEGSSTVLADGEAMSASTHQVLGCHDVGAPAPVRRWKSAPAKSLMKAGSVVVAIPAGAPVMVGGAPTTGASGQAEAGVEAEGVEREVRYGFRFKRDGKERRAVPCEVRVDDVVRADVSTTDITGRVELWVPQSANAIEIVFDQGTEGEERWVYQLHKLKPVDTEQGAKQRLVHLGYLAGPAGSADAAAFQQALHAFQVRAKLPATGEIDPMTLACLQAEHGA